MTLVERIAFKLIGKYEVVLVVADRERRVQDRRKASCHAEGDAEERREVGFLVPRDGLAAFHPRLGLQGGWNRSAFRGSCCFRTLKEERTLPTDRSSMVDFCGARKRLRGAVAIGDGVYPT